MNKYMLSACGELYTLRVSTITASVEQVCRNSLFPAGRFSHYERFTRPFRDVGTISRRTAGRTL